MAFKLTTDEMHGLSKRIASEVISEEQIKEHTTNATAEQLAKLKMDDEYILKMNPTNYAELMTETLQSAYLKKLRGWIRNRRYRAKPIKNQGDKLTTINISKKNVWSLEQLKYEYDQAHPGSDIKQDEIIEKALKNLANNYANKMY